MEPIHGFEMCYQKNIISIFWRSASNDEKVVFIHKIINRYTRKITVQIIFTDFKNNMIENSFLQPSTFGN